MKKNKLKIFVLSVILIAIVISIIVAMNNKKQYKVSEVELDEYKYYILYKDEKMGVIDVSGNVIIDAKYEYIEIPNQSKELFVCYENSNGKALGLNGEELFTKYSDISAIEILTIDGKLTYESDILKYKQNDKYGLIDLEGNQITKPIYDEILSLDGKEGELLVKQNDMYGVINSKGAKIIDVEYESIQTDGFFDEDAKLQYERSGYIVRNKTEEGYRYGYIDNNGKMLLKTEYNEITRITQNLDYKDIYLIARKNGQVGVIRNKEVIVDFEFQNIEYDNTTDLLIMEKTLKYGIYSVDGKEILKPEYDEILLKGLYIYTKKDEEEKYYDVQGNQINDLLYISMNPTENDNYYITIDENGLCGVVDKDNKSLIQNEYIYLEYLFDDYFIASKQNTGFGIINAKGDIVIDLKYDVISRIHGTNMLQAQNITQQVIDIYTKSLQLIDSYKNLYISVKDTYIQVYQNGTIKYYDVNGEELTNKQIYTNNKLISKQKDGKWGFVDSKEKFVIENKYDEVTEFNRYGYAGIKLENKWGVIDEEGNIVLQPTYEFEESLDIGFIGKYYKIYNAYGQTYYTDEI